MTLHRYLYTTNLTTLYCALFIELFFFEHLRCSFELVIDNGELFVSATLSTKSCIAGCSSDTFTSISVKGFFCWLAKCVTDVCESAQHEAQELSELAVDDDLNFFESHRVKNPSEHPYGSPVNGIAFRGPIPKDIPPFSFVCTLPLCCAHRYHSWRALYFFSCPKAPLQEAHF